MSDWTSITLAILSAYLLGSISGSLLIGRIKGVDIRSQGSGNAGATNALRTQGKRFALITVLIDFGKGVLAAAVIAPLFKVNALLVLCAAVLGHCFPIYYQFRGGKGASTAVGGLACIAPMLTLIVVSVWAVLIFLSGSVGPSTVLASMFAALLVMFDGARFNLTDPMSKSFACAMLALVIAMHHANIKRLWLGTEPKFERIRWLYRLLRLRSK